MDPNTQTKPVEGLEPGREWYDPKEDAKTRTIPPLRVLNSLTNTLVEFHPRGGKQVTWYACGPTVYDAAHLGHARNYMSFDIVRRIMEDYFGYQVHLVMNVTDVDDKIIKRSNEAGISFSELTRKFEKEFWDDMQAINVRMPNTITRVSEHMPEIIKFVEQIQDGGMAYVVGAEGDQDKSVYFDTEEYRKTHVYGKLQPRSVGNQQLLKEGEGELTVKDQEKVQKKNPCDFALWKKSKDNEPKWASERWGEGRPGWHIECSAMASGVLGCNIDMHTGGEDLKFPHHDNEIAQSEGCFGNHQWINYFLHAGHLHIEGLKMSKSLKNFITIKAALQRWTSRQIRFLFLEHRYDNGMDYAESTMHQAADLDKFFSEFFQNAHVAIRDENTDPLHSEKWEEREKALAAKLTETKRAVHDALCNNFDTPTAVDALQDIVRLTNVYMSDRSAGHPKGTLIRMVADYATFIFRCFGLIDTYGDFGWSLGGSGAESDQAKEKYMAPVVDVLAQFRDKVRSISLDALSGMKKDQEHVQAVASASVAALLELCDKIRDSDLPPIGVRLEDRSGMPAAWKLDDPEAIARDLDLKRRAAAEKEAKKEEARKREEEKYHQKLKDGAVDPATMFLGLKEKYSAFDENGLPTLDNEGKEVSQKMKKKLVKDQEKQKELHAWYQAEMAKKEKQ